MLKEINSTSLMPLFLLSPQRQQKRSRVSTAVAHRRAKGHECKHKQGQIFKPFAVSGSMKEGELVSTVALSGKYTHWQMLDLQAEMQASGELKREV